MWNLHLFLCECLYWDFIFRYLDFAHDYYIKWEILLYWFSIHHSHYCIPEITPPVKLCAIISPYLCFVQFWGLKVIYIKLQSKDLIRTKSKGWQFMALYPVTQKNTCLVSVAHQFWNKHCYILCSLEIMERWRRKSSLWRNWEGHREIQNNIVAGSVW